MAASTRAARAAGHRVDASAAPADVPELHELEAVVMDQVWRMGKGTVREVLEALNEAEPRVRAYTTIMTIMRRLHTKGLLERERRDRTDIYTPALTREGYAHRRARRQVELLVDEYGDAALAAFARKVEGLSPARLAALRRLAERAESGGGRGPS
jgi:predicted transcriptional regulator